MKTKYVCETCGCETTTKEAMIWHENSHKTTTQYVDNKPILGKAVLKATTKEHGEEVPYEALISYNGKHAWYRFQGLARSFDK